MFRKLRGVDNRGRREVCVHDTVWCGVRVAQCVGCSIVHGAHACVSVLQIVMLIADLEDEIGAGTYIDSAGATQAVTALALGMASAAASASAVSNGVLTGDISAHMSCSVAETGRLSVGTATTPVYEPRTAKSGGGGGGRAAALSAPLMRRKRVPSNITPPPHRDAVRAVLSSNSVVDAGGELVGM